MKIKGMEKMTRELLFNLAKEILSDHEDNLYLSFEFGGLYSGGCIYTSPGTNNQMTNVKNLIEKRLNIKLKASLDKTSQEVRFEWKKFDCMITMISPNKCDLINTKEITGDKIIEVEEQELSGEVETVTRRYREKVIVKTYRCSGGKEYTVETVVRDEVDD